MTDARTNQLLSTVRRATRQGFGAEEQYKALNAARERRKAKAKKRAEQVFSGGWANIPIIRANS